MTSPLIPEFARDLGKAVFNNQISEKDLFEIYAKKAQKAQETLNSFIYFEEKSLKQEITHALQKRKEASLKDLPLLGVSVAIKDNINCEGLPTTCGSQILKGFTSPFDATVIRKLKEKGAVVFGKANCDEFAMGSSNENSSYGAVKNPWDLQRVPGGSSGGSAALVSARAAFLSLGSDTGGSIRQPASFCGVVGLKPTYGSVSRFGLVAYASSLDQIGPFSLDVEDAALAFDAIKGFCELDSRSSKKIDEQGNMKELVEKLKTSSDSKPLKNMKIAYIKELSNEGLSEGVKENFSSQIKNLESLGASLREVSLPSLKFSVPVYYVLATAEASSNLARFDGIRYGKREAEASDSLKNIYLKSRSKGFGSEVKRRIMLGSFVLSSGYYDAYYGKAQMVQNLIRSEFKKAFENFDLLISPTAPSTAFKLGEKVSDPLSMYLSDICTIGLNLAELPGMSLPSGFDKTGLPIGLQLIANSFKEDQIFKAGFSLERLLGLTQRKPAFYV